MRGGSWRTRPLARWLPWVAFLLCLAAPALPARGDDGTAASDTASGESSPEASQGTTPRNSVPQDERLGVQTMCTNCNEANLELGGLDDSRIGVDFNGFALSGGLPRIYAFSILPSEAIYKLDVRPGPGRADQSCEAIGGSVELRTRPPGPRPELQLTGEAGSFGWHKLALLGSARRGPLFARLALTQSQVQGIDADKDGNVETGDTDRWTGLGELGLDLKGAGNLLLGVTRINDDQTDGHGQVELDTFTHEPLGYLHEDTFVDWKEYHLGYDLNLSPSHSIRLRGSRFDRDQRIMAPISRSFEPKQERYLISEEVKQFDLRWEGAAGRSAWLSAGIDAKNDDVSVEGRALPSSQPRAEESVHHRGGFAQADLDLRPNLSLTLGTRYDEFDLDSGTATAIDIEAGTTWELSPITRDKWSPRGEIAWKPAPSIQIKASLGYGFSPPEPAFSEICCGQSPETNAGLEPERSRAVALDLTYQPNPEIKLNLYAHRTEFDNYLIRMVAGSVGLKQKLKNANIRSATLEGLSGLVSWKPNPSFSLSASTTHLTATNDDDEVSLLAFPFAPVPVLVSVTLPMTRIPFIPENSGQITLDYHPRSGFATAAINAQYTGPMLIQHYQNVPFMPLPPAGLLEDYLETDAFWVVNVSGTFLLTSHLDLYWGIDNLFNEVQDDLNDFTTDYNWGPIRGTYAYGGVTYRY